MACTYYLRASPSRALHVPASLASLESPAGLSPVTFVHARVFDRSEAAKPAASNLSATEGDSDWRCPTTPETPPIGWRPCPADCSGPAWRHFRSALPARPAKSSPVHAPESWFADRSSPVTILALSDGRRGRDDRDARVRSGSSARTARERTCRNARVGAA
jgi:hypothetical protein